MLILFGPAHICRWMFGSAAYEKQPKCVRTHFMWRAPTQHILGKGIFRSEFIEPAWIHVHTHGSHVLEVRSREVWFGPEPTNPLRLNHYVLQSKEFFAGKITRGDSHQAQHDTTRNWGYFAAYDANKNVTDTKLADMIGLDCKPVESALKRWSAVFKFSSVAVPFCMSRVLHNFWLISPKTTIQVRMTIFDTDGSYRGL